MMTRSTSTLAAPASAGYEELMTAPTATVAQPTTGARFFEEISRRERWPETSVAPTRRPPAMFPR